MYTTKIMKIENMFIEKKLTVIEIFFYSDYTINKRIFLKNKLINALTINIFKTFFLIKIFNILVKIIRWNAI